VLTIGWSPAPQPGRTLFVAFTYHGADRDGSPRGLFERWESPAVRGHRIVHRDHYANPRSLPYLTALIGDAVGHLSPATPPDLVVDRRFDERLPETVANAFGRVVEADVVDQSEWTRGVLAESHGYDHVVLVYADALGLGCERAERMALRGRGSVLVVNGRRRAFRIDRRLGRRLRLSRWLARTRIAERTLGAVIRPVAGTLALWDRRIRDTQ
jgi:hypothetical protein